MPTRTITKAQVIKEYIDSRGGIAPIDEIARHVLSTGVLGEDWNEAAGFKLAKVEVRTVLKTILNPTTGLPEYFNLVLPNGAGEPLQVYVQEELFTVEHYKQVYDYYKSKGNYYHSIAERIAQRCQQRYGVQLALPTMSPN